MQNPIKNTLGVVILVAASSMSGTWCEVDCPEEDSYVTIDSCPPGQVSVGFTMKEVKEYECIDVDTCTGLHIVDCVLCEIYTYHIAEPICVDRTDDLVIPNPFPGDYDG